MACFVAASTFTAVRVGSDGAHSSNVARRDLTVILRDGVSGGPVPCGNVILLGTKFGSVTDSLGVGTVWARSGRYEVKLVRAGYVDSTLICEVHPNKRDTVSVVLRRRGAGKVPSCTELKSGYD